TLVPIAISACLLGERVRYDGGDKRAVGLLAALAPHVRWVPLCPEVLAGLGVPRPPIQVIRADGGTGVREVERGTDHTARLAAASAHIVATLRAEGVRGFVCKARSPSCGVGDAPHHAPQGQVMGQGDGVMVAALRVALPPLVVASEAELDSAGACAAFLRQVRAT
ncbi:MAG: DUF523 domain-containing protein, partial [Planctomycetota bacterium]|nr:DUF523 domain-containing protein [Planctomycetota bacterium]